MERMTMDLALRRQFFAEEIGGGCQSSEVPLPSIQKGSFSTLPRRRTWRLQFW
jgi:hypothetical protein